VIPILDKYYADKTIGVLTILPYNFGTSGHKLRPKGNVIDNYWMRGPEATPSRSKMIVKPTHCTSLAVHEPTQNSGTNFHVPTNELLFNHYFTKSEEGKQ
jgi:hypothetical protein